MTNTIGRVDFTARIDGRRTPRDAEKIGRDAGKAGSEEFDEAWSKGFRETLDKNAKAAFDRWKKSGKQDGGIYGGTFTRTFTPYIRQAQKTFDQLRVNPNFLGDLKTKFGDASAAAAEVQRHLVDLNREGEISDRVFAGARRQVDEWATAQRNATRDTQLQEQSMERLNTFLTGQRRLYEDNRDAIEKNSSALRDHDRALNLERQQAYTRTLEQTRQRLVDNVAVHTRSTEALRNHIRQVGDANLAYRQFSAYLEQYRSAAGGADRTYISMSANLDKLTKSMRDNDEASRGVSSGWSAIPHNGRQVILIAAAIAGGFGQIATLGSAAAAGLVVFGAAAGGAVVGIGSMVAAFQGLSGDLEKLPESVRPAAEAFQGLKVPLQELQDQLQASAFQYAAGTFASIGESIRAITPSFAIMGETIAGIIQKFADWFASSDGIRLINGLVQNSARIFEKVADIAGQLGEIFLEVFNNPAVQKAIDDMLDGLSGLFDELEDYVKSEQFTTWIENSMTILGELGELISATSGLFRDMVTPEAQQRTEDFLQALTDMMGPLGEFIEVFNQLDIFGVLASMLGDLLSALNPVWEILQPIASIISDSLITSFSILTTVLGLLAPLFIPLQIGFEVIAGWLSKWAEYLQPFIAGFQDLQTAFQNASDMIWNILGPAFDELWQVIIDLLPTAEEFTTWINNFAIPAIMAFAAWLGTAGAQGIKDFAAWLRDTAVPAMRDFWDWLSTKVIPFVIDFANRLISAGKTIGQWAGAVVTTLSILTQPIRFAIDLFNKLASAAAIALGASNAAKNMSGPLPKTAVGGLFNGAQARIIGEAGPEAVVPLNRPLSQVNPDVRWLSAVAQGLRPPGAATGMSTGGGTRVVFEPGSIVVNGAADPRAVALEVVDEIADAIGS